MRGLTPDTPTRQRFGIPLRGKTRAEKLTRVPHAVKRERKNSVAHCIRLDEEQAYDASRLPASAQAAWERLLTVCGQKNLEVFSRFERPEAEQ